MPNPPGQTSSHFKTWVGVCIKAGGSLGPGTEAFEGYFFNMGNPERRFWGGADSWRLGFGLGASVGLTAVVITNCSDPTKELDGMATTDWGVDVALAVKWSAFASAFKHYDFYASLLDWGKKQDSIMPLARYEMLNKKLADGKTALQAPGAGIQVLTFDLPASFGLEASFSYKIGKFRVWSESEAYDRRNLRIREAKASEMAGQKTTLSDGKAATYDAIGNRMSFGGRLPVN